MSLECKEYNPVIREPQLIGYSAFDMLHNAAMANSLSPVVFWTLHKAMERKHNKKMRILLGLLAVVTIAAIIYIALCPTTGSMNMAMAAGYHLAH